MSKVAKPRKKHTRATHYYEWGNEPVHCYTVGYYFKDVWQTLGYLHKDEVRERGLTFNCPYP
jgi:hypothetical protein